jgi:hypothetical protein
MIETDANKPDTDGDGLADGDEIDLLRTSPLKADTDSDGFSDSAEIKSGYDPLAKSVRLGYDLMKEIGQYCSGGFSSGLDTYHEPTCTTFGVPLPVVTTYPTSSADVRRVSSVKQYMTALEIYYADYGQYPVPSQTAGLVLGKLGAKALCSGGFADGCGSGKTFYISFDPDPGSYEYTYYSQQGGRSYFIEFVLEKGNDTLGPGKHMAGPNGVQ